MVLPVFSDISLFLLLYPTAPQGGGLQAAQSVRERHAVTLSSVLVVGSEIF